MKHKNLSSSQNLFFRFAQSKNLTFGQNLSGFASRISQEVIVSFVLIVLLLLFLNPFDVFMPEDFLMMLSALLVVVFAFFASFVWREHAGDERESMHRMFAGRVGFLAGCAMLVAGIVFQSFSHTTDPLLVITLGIMIFAKIGALIYSSYYC